NLQWIDIEWGDGSVEEVNHVTSAFMKHKYSNVGDFEIKLIVAKEVDGEESLSETIRTISVTSDEVAALPPLIDYGILIEDFAPYVTFNLDRSISPNAEIVSVVFDHGDGSFYSGDSFVHTHFYDPGVYVTKLTVTDSNGLSVTQSSQVVITDPSENLVASLNCEQVDDPLNVECEAVAVDKFSELSEITLDWGDGNSQQIPLLQGEFTWDSFEHSYAEEGTYNVTLTVKNIRAETKSSQYSITIEENVDPVNQSPIASIYCQATGNIKEIMCDYSGSDDPDGYITNFNIKISDGSEFNFTNSSPIYHTFDGNGLYEILLTVTDNNGESSSSDTTIGLINQLPVVDVFCESNSIQEITCSSYSYDPDGYIVNTSFDWGEGSQSGTDTSFTANISTGGVTDVEVSIIDNEGEVSKEYRTVFVIENQKPYAGFSCESISNNNLSCTNSSYDPDGGELSYLWEINGQNYQSKNINIMINGNTVYQVSLKVVDIFGSEAIKTDSLSVKGNSTPFAMFNCNFTNFNEMSCLNTSGDPDGDALSYKWYVNDELHDAQVNLNYILRNGERGNIAVKLVVSDGIEEAEFVNNYYVNILPIAKFNCTQENSLVVRCSAEESLDDGAIEGYSWVVNGIDFYEGSFIEIPVNNFNLNTIDLTITDDSSEMATVSQSVKFYNLDLLPEARFTYVVDVGGKSILNAGESLIDGRKVAAFTWFVNGNEIENTEDSAIIYTFPSLGTYNVKLVIIDSQGRESETVKDIIVYDMEVSQPTYEDNSISLSGIDADNNGVRDDIQRAVNSYAKGNNSIKEHLGEYIKLNLGLISSLDDSVVTNSKYFKRRKAVRCIASLVPETEVSTLIQEIDVMSFNTRDRIEKWAVMKEMITDETLDREMEETEQVCTY
ncbi:PKD domain-containing protein, partial [Halobacteriovorax sp.]|uniref:PKD domain-containing protein n=1 Tax=Halobacteriovorax sp. TaxID=2020862 RepID=UPI0035635B07